MQTRYRNYDFAIQPDTEQGVKITVRAKQQTQRASQESFPLRIFILCRNAMKLSSILKEFAILFYFVIFLQGSMVSLPMFVYLLFTVADFGTTEQIFAAIALLGLIIHFLHLSFENKIKKVVVDLFVFACLLSPLIQRMRIVPLERFNYTLFIVPALGFTVFYLVTLVIRTIHVFINKPEAEEKITAE